MEKCALCWDKVPKSETLTGTAWNVTGIICKECVEYVGNEDFKESLAPTIPVKTYNYTNVDEWDWTTYPDTWGGLHGAYGTSYVACNHHLVPFMFEGKDGTYTVHLTGSSSLKSEPGIAGLPTVGVYLDEGWFRGRIASNTAHDLDMTQPASLYIGWPDFGVVDVAVLAEGVEWLLPFLHNKESVIEIACIGGHGRTGTFIAATMIREGWAVNDAVEYIHGGYCNKAIETKTQEDLLEQYYNLIHGVVTNESPNQLLHKA